MKIINSIVYLGCLIKSLAFGSYIFIVGLFLSQTFNLGESFSKNIIYPVVILVLIDFVSCCYIASNIINSKNKKNKFKTSEELLREVK